MSLQIDEHRHYITDAARVGAFARALNAVVRPGDVVVDLACGTGILGLLACRAGAARVYAIDSGSMLDIARRLARANGFADRIVHVSGHSTRVTLPERADVVVCDQIGQLSFEAGVIELLADARARFLKPGGIVIPNRVRMHLAPAETPDLHADVAVWDARPNGFDMSPVRLFAANSGRPVFIGAEALLGDGPALVTYDLTADSPEMQRGEATVRVTRAGAMHGLAGWFTADLAPEITMTNAPGAPDRIGRRNVYLPIDPPCEVQAGDQVRISVTVRSAELMLNWRASVTRGGRILASASHSTASGMLLTREEIAATRRDTVPVLNPWARARQTVLTLCDGRNALGAIERATFDAHRDLFPSPDAAATFVAEVVTRYAESADQE